MNPPLLFLRRFSSIRNETYLILHNALLEPRPTHGNLPRVLTPRPDALVVRRLCNPHLLPLLGSLLQHLVERTLGRRGDGIGLGNVRLRIALDRVVGGDLVACSGRGGIAGKRPGRSRCASGAQGAESYRKHVFVGCWCRRAAQLLGKISRFGWS
jgi:hypothetical protein